MLVLTRKVGERIIINENIHIVILQTVSGQVRLGIDAPSNVPVHREEIYEKIKREGVLAKKKARKYKDNNKIHTMMEDR